MREMNEIEQMFYNEFIRQEKQFFKKWHISIKDISKQIPLTPQYSYGGYILDFVYEVYYDQDKTPFRFCIEIDGQESHKTKAQRLNDYQRERYLQMNDFHVIRFTASEIYVNTDVCVRECKSIISTILNGYTNYSEYGLEMYCQAEKDLKSERGL